MTKTLLFIGAVAMTCGLAGCEEKGIGRLCDVGVDAGTNATEAIINGAALECPSRVCLAAVPNAPSVMNSFYKDEQAQCTARCSSDDDCGDGLVNKNDKRLCHSSFKCAVATTTGP